MKEKNVFNILWKIDIVLIFLFGLILVAVLLFSAYNIYQEVFRTRNVPGMVNIETRNQISPEWRLGDFDSLYETDILIAPVYSTQTYQASYYEKGTSAVRNYLFVNAVDKSSHWLVPHNDYLFLPYSTEHDDSNWDSKVIWIRYEVVKSDTNQDERLTSEDQRTISLSDPSGENYSEVISDVDQVLGYETLDSNTLLVFYSNDSVNYLAEVDVPSRTITTLEELPEIQS